MIRQHHLEGFVFIKGFVPLEQVAEIMASVDLGVVPKRQDSFGNEAFSTKIMEFMAMNVPVIASRTRIDQYYFSDNMLQFFESGNAEDLAAKIITLVHDQDRRTALQECSSKYIESNNWDVKKYEYLNLVDRLVSNS
jgi:glycosyltransferase involved in cell wall biosynthesis